MSDVSSVTNHFPTANEGFVTTLSGTISAGATTVGLNSVAGLTDGSVFVGIIEPDEAKEQVFTGIVDTAGSQITGVKWTKGTNATHTAGVTVVDYVTSTHLNMMTKGIEVHTDQDGTLKAGAVDVAGVLAADVVETDKIKDANVTTAKLADSSVTPAKRSDGFATGSFVRTSTGDYSVTGVGFKPKMVEFFYLAAPSTNTIRYAEGVMTEDDQSATSISYATSNVGMNSSKSACIIRVSPGSSTPDTLASFVSMDADGFTINFSSNSGGGSPEWAWKAYA